MRLFASFINRTIEGVFSSSRLLIAGHLAILLCTKWPMKKIFLETSTTHNPTRSSLKCTEEISGDELEHNKGCKGGS